MFGRETTMDHIDSNRETLERAVAEIEVLESIYGVSDPDEEADEGESSFRVVSLDTLAMAKQLLNGDIVETSLHTIDSILHLPLSPSNCDIYVSALLRIAMPPGYPVTASAAVSVEVPTLTRSIQDNLTQELNEISTKLLGQESIITIVQEFQELGTTSLEEHQQTVNSSQSPQDSAGDEEDSALPTFSRQWLFMDHIKAERRRAQMIQKANDLNVGGLIKPGYPGVCVVEGESINVDEFSRWMKQIWIGAVIVRGEVTMKEETSKSLDSCRRLPTPLRDLGNAKSLPNMGVLGAFCREVGLEDEFLEYIMRIRS